MVTRVADDSQPASLERALALHQVGKTSEAAGMYDALLRTEPANADLWGLLSIAQLQLRSDEEALESWRKCLAIGTAVPIRLRNITNFLLAVQKRGGIGALPNDFLDGLDIPDWPRDLPLDSNNQTVVLALARCLTDFGLKETAVRLLDGATGGLSADPDFLAKAAPVMIAAGHPGKVLELVRPLTSNAQSGNVALLIAHAAAALAAGRHEEAEITSRQAREAAPVFLSPKVSSQRMLIGVLNTAPRIIKEIRPPSGLHFSSNTPSILARKMNDEFRFLSIFPEAQSLAQALAAVPRPELIINNWVNAENLSKADTLEFITDFADSLGQPVINHPRRAFLTTRQRNAERLAGIANLLVPRITRVHNAPEKRQPLLRMIGEEFGFPVIIRNPFTQEGGEAVKIDTPAELEAHLSTVGSPQLYAIQYIHNPVPEGAYRRIRAAVIGDEMLMINAYFGSRWNVHRRDHHRPGFDPKGTAIAFAQKIMSRPEEALGKPAMAALREICSRTPLEIFGIDFDLLPDGRVLFFETNAAMSLHMREKENLPETLSAMRQAYRRLFANPPGPPSRTEARQ